MGLHVTGDPDVDRLLGEDPLALVIGMLLDQQVPMERAFAAPYRLRERLGGELVAERVAAMSDEEIEAVFAQKPALHRFPASMARRTRDLCAHLVEHYGGDAARIWSAADSGAQVLHRLTTLPGYGDQKARILLAVLGKRLGTAPPGWREAAAPYSDEQPRSVADIDSPEAVQVVREWKRRHKAR
ncbi:MAG: Fe-S cluster assembly protein HesB [Actinobacteria bacterium]|nr:Fe-S cluster assembly protein HesB [Actinomycetota bacterium]